MPSDNELLMELVGLLKRSPADQVNDFISEAELRSWAQPRVYAVEPNTVRDFAPMKASFVRIVAEMRAGFFRAGGGDFGSIYVNGGPAIPFPDCPEHAGGNVEDSTTNVDATVAHVATFRMPIYKLRVANTNAHSDILVYVLDVGEYEQHGETRLDTFDTNQKLLLDELTAILGIVTANGANLTSIVTNTAYSNQIHTILSDVWLPGTNALKVDAT